MHDLGELDELGDLGDLGAFQRAFGRALLVGGASLGDATSPAIDVALSIHRNTSTKGLVDALAANYPTVAQLVGEEWFKACAIEYARAHPARSPVLATYGETFAAFLADFPPAAELPYLTEVARIDRLWVESHTARDAAVLTSAALGLLPHSELASVHLTLHPAARLAWVDHSAATIWVHHRSLSANGPSDASLEIEDAEEGILLTRPVGQVEYQRLDRAAYEFLTSLNNGARLGAAAEAALTRDAAADIAGLLAQTLIAGTFECRPEMLP